MNLKPLFKFLIALIIKELMQKLNDTYFEFEILYHLKKKISLLQKLFQKKILFIFVFVFVLFCLFLKKLCNFVNKDYYYY